jgi:hypothetical protein
MEPSFQLFSQITRPTFEDKKLFSSKILVLSAEYSGNRTNYFFLYGTIVATETWCFFLSFLAPAFFLVKLTGPFPLATSRADVAETRTKFAPHTTNSLVSLRATCAGLYFVVIGFFLDTAAPQAESGETRASEFNKERAGWRASAPSFLL